MTGSQAARLPAANALDSLAVSRGFAVRGPAERRFASWQAGMLALQSNAASRRGKRVACGPGLLHDANELMYK